MTCWACRPTLPQAKKEVHAWTIRKGAKAPEAAGIIHSDFEKGFIRAEVMKYDDLIKFGFGAKSQRSGQTGSRRQRLCGARWRHHALSFQCLSVKFSQIASLQQGASTLLHITLLHSTTVSQQRGLNHTSARQAYCARHFRRSCCI
jgi:hypothetical protein